MEMIHGGDIYTYHPKYDFSANISPLGLPDSIRQAVCAQLDCACHYPDPQSRRLRSAIEAYLNEIHEGAGIHASWVTCGNGAADLIYRLVWAQSPRKALLIAPSFLEYSQALQTVDCEIIYYDCPQNTLSPDHSLLALMTDDVDLMFICNPNNPTGLLMDRELMKAVVDRAEQKNIRLVVDECFLEFTGQEVRDSVIAMLSHKKHIFVLKSFTKLYAMPGIRLGYGLCSDIWLNEKICTCGQAWPVGTVAESAGIAALADEAYKHRAVDYVCREREFLMKGLDDLKIYYMRGCANYLLLRIPSDPDLFDHMLEQGILIRRCENYRNLKWHDYRIAVNAHDANVRLLEALAAVIGKGVCE